MIMHGVLHDGHVEIIDKEKLKTLGMKSIDVEIFVPETDASPMKIPVNVRGAFQKNADTELMKTEKEAWAKAAMGKHASR